MFKGSITGLGEGARDVALESSKGYEIGAIGAYDDAAYLESPPWSTLQLDLREDIGLSM
jgi:hypothetical protein